RHRPGVAGRGPGGRAREPGRGVRRGAPAGARGSPSRVVRVRRGRERALRSGLGLLARRPRPAALLRGARGDREAGGLTAALPPLDRRNAAAALFIARVVYAFNWYNIGAVLPLIGVGLNASTSQLGLVLGIYLLGVGLFQIPGGMAALRWGARPVALAGLCVMGVFGALSALSPDWQILAAARFATGAGAAFFFAPGLSLVASYYPHEQRAPIIGLYNGVSA
ncbi:Major facilitator superfamily MFS-1, partial [mine drainage metagenome]